MDALRGQNAPSGFLLCAVCAGVSAAFAVKLFKSWINEKDINSVAVSLRKVGMDNRLMVAPAWGLVLGVGRLLDGVLTLLSLTGTLSCQQTEL